MSREKQIEEMAELICDNKKDNGICSTDDCICNYNCEYKYSAEALYEQGYRKQSEWISVAERLPELYETVLVFCKIGVSQLQCVSEMIEPNGKRWSAVCGLPVTHWMPLPEAPKMKGGAE